MERGDRLRILRLLCGYSQSDLALKLQLSQGNVATWERKDMFPRDPEIARKLAVALEAPVGYLAFGDPLINVTVWFPQIPQNPRHRQACISVIDNLFPQFCEENHLNCAIKFDLNDGCVVFFGQDGDYRCMLCADGVLSDLYVRAANYPIKCVGSLEVNIRDISRGNLIHINETLPANNSIRADELSVAMGKVNGRNDGQIKQLTREIRVSKSGDLFCAYSEGASATGANRDEAIVNLLLSQSSIRIAETQ
ncbi:XRE family transcriptional regulator [bacterium]|nr:XRE family transcriptional regulator [bacterium]